MVRNKDRKRVVDVKVTAREGVAQHHQLLICDIMICAITEVKKPFVPKIKVWRLNEDTASVRFESKFQRLAQVSEDWQKAFGNQLRRTCWHLLTQAVVGQSGHLDI